MELTLRAGYIHSLFETVCHIKRKEENLEQDADIHKCKTRKKNIGVLRGSLV
jgi:hypothetical protein